MDVAEAIDAEARSVTLTRVADGTYTENGDYVPGAATETAILAAVQPMSGRKLMDMPEGIRNEARALIWSRSELRTDDKVSHDGDDYRVIFVWKRRDGGFWRAAMGELK